MWERVTSRTPILAVFSPFSPISKPLWSRKETPEEPNFPIKVPFDFQREHVELYRSGKWASNSEIWPCRWVPLFWACQLHDFWSSGKTSHSANHLQCVGRSRFPSSIHQSLQIEEIRFDRRGIIRQRWWILLKTLVSEIALSPGRRHSPPW